MNNSTAFILFGFDYLRKVVYLRIIRWNEYISEDVIDIDKIHCMAMDAYEERPDLQNGYLVPFTTELFNDYCKVRKNKNLIDHVDFWDEVEREAIIEYVR